MTIPGKEDCLKLLRENGTPENIIAHTMAVHDFAMRVVDRLERQGHRLDRRLVAAAALLHDIEKIKPNHVLAGHDLLVRKGHPEVARVVLKHGLEHLDDERYVPHTTEEKIVFYADKRVKNTTVVTVEERFADIKARYDAPHIDEEQRIVKAIERELLNGDSPDSQEPQAEDQKGTS